jgi:hypothetical protein
MLPVGRASLSSAALPSPGAYSLGPPYHIIYIIIVAIIKGSLVLDIGPTHFTAAASLARGLAPWQVTGCRLPSGAMTGITQAFILTALFAWPGR